MKTYLSWSGGKDSTACVILAHKHNIPIDLIVISLPYFDKEKGIYADHPLHIDFIFVILQLVRVCDAQTQTVKKLLTI